MVRTKRRNKNRYSQRRVSKRRVSKRGISKKNNKRSRKIYKRKKMRGGSEDVKLPDYIPHNVLVVKHVAHLSLILARGIYPILSPDSPLNDLSEDILMKISRHLARMVQPYKVGNRVIMKDGVDFHPIFNTERNIKNVLITEIPKDREGIFKGIIFSDWMVGYTDYEFRLENILGKIKGFAVGEECMVMKGDQWYEGIIVGAPDFGGGPSGDEPEIGKYHVYIQALVSKPPDYSNTGYYNNIPETDIDYLKQYPDGSPNTVSWFQGFTHWKKDLSYRGVDY